MGIFSKLKQTFSSKKDGDRYLSGLDKSKKSFSERIRKLALGFTGVNEEFLEDLMVVLLEADIGIKTAQKIVDEVESRAMDQKLKSFDEISECLIEVMHELYASVEDEDFHKNEDGPTVILMVGVNGSGKTTTTAKLTKLFQSEGSSVVLAAADTFRAAAGEQLAGWANRAGVDMIGGAEGSDPASVVFDAVNAAKARHVDVLLCDTAGRLHNKKNLMEELKKINRIIDREFPDAHRENLVVLDGTTGQNALAQAREFGEAAELTGIILTKMDGTAKGGIAVAIQSELNVPVKYIGVGEDMEDLQKFDPEQFVNALFDGKTEEE